MAVMTGTKRRSDVPELVKPTKKTKFGSEKPTSNPKVQKPKPTKLKFDASDNEDDFEKFETSSEHNLDEVQTLGNHEVEIPVNPERQQNFKSKPARDGNDTGFLNGTSSREAHAKQKALAQERKFAKPNADSVYRSKQIWERLRRKSHVPKDERKGFVSELFDIITGRVKEFVFKHDSVRVIQCALKYATPDQKKQIAEELRGTYKELAEGKYAKFLVAKIVTLGDEVRDMIVPEFYGHVKRLMRHPEASWILDDIYRGLATSQQKALLLREWYGPEFTLFRNEGRQESSDTTADLAKILAQNPEMRGPVLQHLKEMTNQLVQKKTTGFTMLHDALLQYFLVCKPGSPEAVEFLDMLRDDEEGDCFKNLAFTESGSRLVCLALAYGSSKDRRTILKFFKTHIKLLAADAYGHHVLITAYEVIDDTVMTSKAIFSELLGKDMDKETREQDLVGQAQHLIARVPLLFPLTKEAPKWLVTKEENKIMHEIRQIRESTSKKDPETRRLELVKAMSQPLLDLIASQAMILAETIFGCYFVFEVLIGGIGEKQTALDAVADLANAPRETLETAQVGRLLKRLVQGGTFDKATRTIIHVDPPLNFGSLLYQRIIGVDKNGIVEWASGPNSFVVLAMLEADDFVERAELIEKLSKDSSKLDLNNAGARMIFEKLNIGNQGKVTKQGKAPNKDKGVEAKKRKST